MGKQQTKQRKTKSQLTLIWMVWVRVNLDALEATFVKMFNCTTISIVCKFEVKKRKAKTGVIHCYGNDYDLGEKLKFDLQL